MNLWCVIDGKSEVYHDQKTDRQRSLLVRADSAEAALAKYQKFQQGQIPQRNPRRKSPRCVEPLLF